MSYTLESIVHRNDSKSNCDTLVLIVYILFLSQKINL